MHKRRTANGKRSRRTRRLHSTINENVITRVMMPSRAHGITQQEPAELASSDPERRQDQILLDMATSRLRIGRWTLRQRRFLLRRENRSNGLQLYLRRRLRPIKPDIGEKPEPASAYPAAAKQAAALLRCESNPILQPRAQTAWDSLAVFNAASITVEGKIHLVYRAIGCDCTSVFGHAISSDGISIEKRSGQPVYADTLNLTSPTPVSTEDQSPYRSGNSRVGCEDPRLTQLGDRIYMTYTAFDGSNPPGVALTSIGVDDFCAERWNWQTPKLISNPRQAHKNWVLFPETINGKYAILHGISPQVQIDFLGSLENIQAHSIRSHYDPSGNENDWDNHIRGVGPPPIKTTEGWLIFYHAMDRHDPGRYKVGAMLLDLSNPQRILAKLPYPLLQPDARYENDGLKRGVVYTCGAACHGENILIYYGGADTVLCVATVKLITLLDELRGQRARNIREHQPGAAHA